MPATSPTTNGRVSAQHRKGLAEALSQITAALTISERGKPTPGELRAALREWAFNTAARAGEREAEAAVPEQYASCIHWVRSHSLR